MKFCPKHNIKITGCSQSFICQEDGLICPSIPEPTPSEIKAWVKKINAMDLPIMRNLPVFEGWDRKLWSKHYDEIVEFIESRFKTTLLRNEYYISIFYLTKELPKEVLFVPFRHSPQYLRMLRGETGNSNIATPKTPFKEIGSSLKQGVSSIKMLGDSLWMEK